MNPDRIFGRLGTVIPLICFAVMTALLADPVFRGDLNRHALLFWRYGLCAYAMYFFTVHLAAYTFFRKWCRLFMEYTGDIMAGLKKLRRKTLAAEGVLAVLFLLLAWKIPAAFPLHRPVPAGADHRIYYTVIMGIITCTVISWNLNRFSAECIRTYIERIKNKD